MTSSTSISSPIRCGCGKPAVVVGYVGAPKPEATVEARCKTHCVDMWYWFDADKVRRDPDSIIMHLRRSKRDGVSIPFEAWVESRR